MHALHCVGKLKNDCVYSANILSTIHCPEVGGALSPVCLKLGGGGARQSTLSPRLPLPMCRAVTS